MKFILSFITFIGIAFNSLCCSCYNDIEEMNIARFNDNAAIFIGTVDSVSSCNKTYSVYFNINKVYKGNFQSRVVIQEVDCESLCALNFSQSHEYLVYASYSNGSDELKIEACNGTRKLLSKQELEFLKTNSLKFNNSNYLENEIKKWDHEMELLEKISSKTSGTVKTQFLNGKSTGEGKLVNGLPDGEWTYYYPDGNIKAKGSYLKGKREGIWTEYAIFHNTFDGDANLNGNNRKKFLIKSTGNYQNGLKEGNWERTNIDGTFNVLIYQKGKFIKEGIKQH